MSQATAATAREADCNKTQLQSARDDLISIATKHKTQKPIPIQPNPIQSKSIPPAAAIALVLSSLSFFLPFSLSLFPFLAVSKTPNSTLATKL
jgi:hypothetical protein